MKVKQTLPKGDANGLNGIARDLVEDPAAQRVVIGLIDCVSYKVDAESGERDPTIRFLRVEVVDDADRAVFVQRLMQTIAEERGVQPAIAGIDRAAGLERDDEDEVMP